MRYLILIAMLLSITGCFHLTGVEHTLYGHGGRGMSGGETMGVNEGGYKAWQGQWGVGTAVKTIWGK